MAKQIQVVITDDIDGGEAHETIVFGLDGSSLEIDLNKLNAAQFRKTVAPYIEHGRRVSRGRARAARPARDRGHSSDVREWAKQRASRCASAGASPHPSSPSMRRPTPELGSNPDRVRDASPGQSYRPHPYQVVARILWNWAPAGQRLCGCPREHSRLSVMAGCFWHGRGT
jgi:Lsr2